MRLLTMSKAASRHRPCYIQAWLDCGDKCRPYSPSTSHIPRVHTHHTSHTHTHTPAPSPSPIHFPAQVLDFRICLPHGNSCVCCGDALW